LESQQKTTSKEWFFCFKTLENQYFIQKQLAFIHLIYEKIIGIVNLV